MAVTYKAKSGVNQVVFRPCTWKNPQIFLARAFGTRDVFTVILLGTRAKSDHSRASAFGAFSVFECFCEEVTYKAKSGGNLVFFCDHVQEKTLDFSLSRLRRSRRLQCHFPREAREKRPSASQCVWRMFSFRMLW